MAREEQFRFGTGISLGCVELEIPVNLPRRSVQ